MRFKSKIIVIITVLITTATCYGVYSFFEMLKADEIAEREQRLNNREAAIRVAEKNVENKRIIEAQRLVELEKERLALEEKRQNKKYLYAKKFAEIDEYKKAQKAAKKKQSADRLMEDARELKNPEVLGGRRTDEIQRATYLYIRNNPKDFIGNYKTGNFSAGFGGRGNFTKGGANGLMLFATVGKNLKAIKEIIAIGHDINAKNKSGHTALMFASAYNTAEVVQFFLDEGADKSLKEYVSEGNALHLAARYNPKPEILEVLLKAGFSLEETDNQGNTPLLLATKYNQNIQVVQKLVELGANVNATDNKGDVSYAYALDRIKKKLSQLGAFLKITDELNDKVLDSLLPI